MFNKILWLDLETTGIDCIKNGIIQISGMVEINKEIKEEFNIFSNVFPTDIVNEAALAISGHTKEDLLTFPDPTISFRKFINILGKYVDKFDSNDKFIIAGYNVGFDKNFIWEHSKKCGEKYFGSFVRGYYLDVIQYILFYAYQHNDFKPDDYKLSTIAQYLNIELDAHNAIADIKATRQIFTALTDKEAQR